MSRHLLFQAEKNISRVDRDGEAQTEHQALAVPEVLLWHSRPNAVGEFNRIAHM
jgi:hypothetical protein